MSNVPQFSRNASSLEELARDLHDFFGGGLAFFKEQRDAHFATLADVGVKRNFSETANSFFFHIAIDFSARENLRAFALEDSK